MTDHEDAKPPVQPPVVTPTPRQFEPTAIDRLVPTANGDALLSYYLGLFSIFPVFGIVMGGIAIWRGRIAIRRIKDEPSLPGKTHAKVGIGCGTVGFLFNAFCLIFVLILFLKR